MKRAQGACRNHSECADITMKCCAMYILHEAHDRDCAHIFSTLCIQEALEGINLRCLVKHWQALQIGLNSMSKP